MYHFELIPHLRVHCMIQEELSQSNFLVNCCYESTINVCRLASIVYKYDIGLVWGEAVRRANS